MVFHEGSVWNISEELNVWEMINEDPEKQAKGACNCLALGNKKVVLVKCCSRLVKDIEQLNFDYLESRLNNKQIGGSCAA